MSDLGSLVDGFFEGKDRAHAWQDRVRSIKRQDKQDVRTQEAHDLNMDVTRNNDSRAGERHGLNMRVTTNNDRRADESHGLNMRVQSAAEAERAATRIRDQQERERIADLQAQERSLLSAIYPDNVSAPRAPAQVPRSVIPDQVTPALPQDPVQQTTVAAPPPAVTPAVSSPAAASAAATTPGSEPVVAARKDKSASKRALHKSRAERAVAAKADDKIKDLASRADLAEAALTTGTGEDGQPLPQDTVAAFQSVIAEAEDALIEIEAQQTPGAEPRQAARRGITPAPAPVSAPAGTPAIAPAAATPPPLSEQAPPLRADEPSPPVAATGPGAGYSYTNIMGGQSGIETPDVASPRARTSPHQDITPQDVSRATDATPNTPAPKLVAPADAATSEAAKVAASVPANAKPGAAPAMSPEQSEQVKAVVADRENNVARERLFNFYMRNGMPEKAEALNGFFERQETQQAVKMWTEAVFATQIGDDAAAEAALAEHYNRNFGDGYEVVRDGEIFIRNDNNDITGASIDFRNMQTGEVFTRKFDSVTDFYAEAINALAPTQIFEHQWNQFQAAQERRAELAQKAQDMQIAAQHPDPAAYTDRVLSIADKLAEFDLTPQGADVYISKAIAMIAAEGQQAQNGDVPRYRPQ